MMTRLVKTLFFLGLGLLVFGLVAPSFINWNNHKSALMAQISPYFSRKISVDGNISFQVLPQPELLLQNVTIANARGTVKYPLMTLKSLEAQVSLAPLLQGRIVVKSINLVKPVLNLDVYDNGKTSLSGLFTSSDDIGAAAQVTQLEKISIFDGTLHYVNHLTGMHKVFNNLTLNVSANTLFGPYHVSGNMAYQQTNVNLEIDTGIFDQSMTAPLKLSFAPVENMPQINFNGTVSLQDGLNLAGGLSVSNGSLASLGDIPALNAFYFWNKDVNLTGVMNLKRDSFALQNIDAKFRQAGHLRGKIYVRIPREGISNIQAYLSGKELDISRKPSKGYPQIPAGYKISLGFRGENTLWNGQKLQSADISTYSDKGNWRIRSAKITLPGKSIIKFSGTVMPQTGNAIYTHLHVTTDNLGKMVNAFNPDSASVFNILGDTNAPLKKMRMHGNLETSPGKISFYDIDATFGKSEKVSGVINITDKQECTAMLHLDGWKSTDFSDTFLKALRKSNTNLQLTADNFTKNGLSISGITFNAQTNGKDLEIKNFSGNLTGNDTFSLTGKVKSLTPVSGLDVSYTLKAAHAPMIAKNLGVNLPPLEGRNFSIKGTVTQTMDNAYVYTAEGRADNIVIYKQTVRHPVFKLDSPTPANITISRLTGRLWNGTLQSTLSFTAKKNPSAWSSTFKGDLKKANLLNLQEQLGLKGFSIGKGDITFNLNSPDNTLKNMIGDIYLQADKLTVGDFNIEHLPALLRKLKKVPVDLANLVNDIAHHDGASVFKNMRAAFKLDHGKITVQKLNAANTAEKMTLSGTTNFVSGHYAISGNVQLTQPKDFPALAISRSSKDGDYKINGSKALKNYVIKHLPPPPAPKKPKKAVKKPTSEKKKDQPIDEILNRLNAPEKSVTIQQPQVKPAPATLTPKKKSPLSAPGQPTINRLLKQMQTQQMLKPDNSLPMTTLTP